MNRMTLAMIADKVRKETGINMTSVSVSAYIKGNRDDLENEGCDTRRPKVASVSAGFPRFSKASPNGARKDRERGEQEKYLQRQIRFSKLKDGECCCPVDLSDNGEEGGPSNLVVCGNPLEKERRDAGFLYCDNCHAKTHVEVQKTGERKHTPRLRRVTGV